MASLVIFGSIKKDTLKRNGFIARIINKMVVFKHDQ